MVLKFCGIRNGIDDFLHLLLPKGSQFWNRLLLLTLLRSVVGIMVRKLLSILLACSKSLCGRG